VEAIAANISLLPRIRTDCCGKLRESTISCGIMGWGVAMSSVINDIESAALDLDPEHRARLAVRLIESLDSSKTLSPEEIELLWMHEAEERLRQLETGAAEPLSSEQVFAEARRHLK
jgi:hypothetical protein